MLTFQQLIFRLQNYWNQQNCIVLQPIDLEVGAGTSHTATFFRAIDPEPWKASYVQLSRRPKDGRYGKSENRLQQYYQYQVVLKPVPRNILEIYLNSLNVLGFKLKDNDLRFIEDNWENPSLGAYGVGWEIWINGIEISQFTYFQQIGGLNCHSVVEITYGLERLAMHLQQVKSVYDIIWEHDVTYRDICYQNEVEQSIYNFDHSNSDLLLFQFDSYENEAKRLINLRLIFPAYEMVLKGMHIFNLLDARGIIAVTERTTYITRIRNLSRKIAKIYLLSKEKNKISYVL